LPYALGKLHHDHGRLSLAEVVAPAARLAEEGFSAPSHLAAVWALRAPELAEAGPGPYLEGGRPPALFRHEKLAALLRAYGERGAPAIMSGATANQLIDGIRARGGHWRIEDLEAANAREGEILHGQYRDCQVTTIGRQGWGHTLLEMLAILDRFPKFGPALTGREACTLAAVIETCFDDRPQRLGSLDPKPDGLPFEELLDPHFVAKRADAISEGLALEGARSFCDAPALVTHARNEDQDTTHLSTLDTGGIAVSLTMSIGPHFGLRGTDASFGLFPAKSYRMGSDPVPGARDVTEMTPAIISRGGRVLLSIGGAGSERIPGAVAQTIVNVVDRGLALPEALRAPRVNFKDGCPRVHADAGHEVIEALRSRWSRVEVHPLGHESHLGIVQVVGERADGRLDGAADPSWDGTCRVA
jgi:gamma-glutamyltranspeptidase/glutathione hydrolase